MGMPRTSSTLDMDDIAQGAKDAVGAGLCGKPFRWDQRLFSVMLGSGGGGGGSEGGVEGYDGASRLGGGVTESTVSALRVRERERVRELVVLGGTREYACHLHNWV